MNIRDKCPKDFIFVGRSKPIESLTPRGGVAVFRRVDTEISVDVVSDEFRDCVVFRILPLDIVCVANYIPPSNSKYTTPDYMDNLKLFMLNFKDSPTCIIGDMNARFGQPPAFAEEITYKHNPDENMNTNGHALLNMLEEDESFHILNGFDYDGLECDSTYIKVTTF